MLSMTETDAPRISLATPDDVRAVSEQSLNIIAGALSPLWLPFWAASAVGVSLWGAGQALKRSLIGLPFEADAVLAAKWPGFSPTLPAPAAKAVETVEDAVTETVAAAETVAEAVIEPITAEAVEVVEDAPKVAAEAIETATETVEETVEATQAASEAVIDPVIEAPVVPEAVEDIAETDLFKPLSAKTAPRRTKKR